MYLRAKIVFLLALLATASCLAASGTKTTNAQAEKAVVQWQVVFQPLLPRVKAVREKIERYDDLPEMSSPEVYDQYDLEIRNATNDLRLAYAANVKKYVAAEQGVLRAMLDQLKKHLQRRSQRQVANFWLIPETIEGRPDELDKEVNGGLYFLTQQPVFEEFLDAYLLLDETTANLSVFAVFRTANRLDKDRIPVGTETRRNATKSVATWEPKTGATLELDFESVSSSRRIRREFVVFVGAIVQLQSFTHSLTVSERWHNRPATHSEWVKQTMKFLNWEGDAPKSTVVFGDTSLSRKDNRLQNPFFQKGVYKVWPR